MDDDMKLQHALHADNGIWLCGNHHKLFDINMLMIKDNGEIKHRLNIPESDEEYITSVTLYNTIADNILTSDFRDLHRRNTSLNEAFYTN